MNDFRQYDSETLKKLQQTELSILRDFVTLCEQHKLTYFGIAGTGIGAIRHNGFIPWDDDIDVAMPREDFDRFVEISKRDWSDRYLVVNGQEYPDYPLMTTRWTMKGTTFIEWALKGINCPLGIFLDIYPMDRIPDDEKQFARQAREAFIWSKLLILRSTAFPVLSFGGFKKILVHGVCACMHALLTITHVSKPWLYRRCLTCSTRYNGTQTGRIDFLCDTTAYMNIHELKDFYPMKKIRFEDLDLSFPGNIEENLRLGYGDFMTLPPVEKRKNHMPFQIAFRKDEE